MRFLRKWGGWMDGYSCVLYSIFSNLKRGNLPFYEKISEKSPGATQQNAKNRSTTRPMPRRTAIPRVPLPPEVTGKTRPAAPRGTGQRSCGARRTAAPVRSAARKAGALFGGGGGIHRRQRPAATPQESTPPAAARRSAGSPPPPPPQPGLLIGKAAQLALHHHRAGVQG